MCEYELCFHYGNVERVSLSISSYVLSISDFAGDKPYFYNFYL